MKRQISAILIFLMTSAHAQFVDGNALKKLSLARERVENKAANDSDYQESAQYFGYVMAAFDSNRSFLCSPEQFTAGQLSAIVTAYLKENPQKWHFAGDKLVVLAVSEAFPCPWSKYKPLKK